jgi:energy-coupling factor transporter ATP-binding protein EcfA2
MPGRAQASEPSYELHSLGWKSFQDLCATIASEILGQTVHVFSPTRDGGRDGAFHGQWKNGSSTGLSGSFTIQCKFSSRDALLSPSEVHDELAKATRLATRGLANNYILLTNLRVSGIVEEALREQFLAIAGIEHFLLFGKEWITLKIRESPALRMLVPRVYGLGDLTQILDERAYGQATEILSAFGDDLSKFVVTQPHTLAARAVAEHGFVLLLGEPAAGKSTIAACLAIAALDRWGCSTLKVRGATEFVQHWNLHEPRQFFWIDDAFGTTQYQRELVTEWNLTWPHLTTAIKKGARVLFTSRDYIYRAARHDLKTTAFPIVTQSQVVINVQGLSHGEKERILYNHLKLGGQPRSFKTLVKPFLKEIASSPHFLPEIARRLGSPQFTRNLVLDRQAIRRFVEEPLNFLVDVVTTLDCESRAALALVFMRGGSLPSPVELTANEEAALQTLGVALPAARDALVALDGSLLSLVRSGDNATWRFKHPTVSDAYATIVAGNPELLDLYISWTSAEKLVAEVTCGDVGLEGVKVIVPQNRFQRFLERLREIGQGRALLTFLATRCSRDFLILYLSQHNEIADRICEPGSYLSSVSEVDLLVKLHEQNLLPASWRERFVERARELALETPDVDFLGSERIRALFLPDEISGLLTLIEAELVPALSSFVTAWADCCDSDQDPDDWLNPLREVIEVLSKEFRDDDRVVADLQDIGREIDWAVEKLLESKPRDDDDSDYRYESGSGRMESGGERTIFDDVDE